MKFILFYDLGILLDEKFKVVVVKGYGVVEIVLSDKVV